MDFLLHFFLILNAVAFALTAYDKYAAKTQKKRISERTLLLFVLFGVTIGSGFAMLIFRHKTSKTSYLWQFWGIVIVQVLITFLWFKFESFSL
jgi:uncharacterized membrane protein YsdA (DUF1294 family)